MRWWVSGNLGGNMGKKSTRRNLWSRDARPVWADSDDDPSDQSGPGRLLGAARGAGRVGELDWICGAAAFSDRMAAQLPSSISLFVNVEPDSLVEPCPDDLLETIWEAETKLRVFIDITGRALARYPT